MAKDGSGEPDDFHPGRCQTLLWAVANLLFGLAFAYYRAMNLRYLDIDSTSSDGTENLLEA